jgi:hypothetical protein
VTSASAAPIPEGGCTHIDMVDHGTIVLVEETAARLGTIGPSAMNAAPVEIQRRQSAAVLAHSRA